MEYKMMATKEHLEKAIEAYGTCTYAHGCLVAQTIKDFFWKENLYPESSFAVGFNNVDLFMPNQFISRAFKMDGNAVKLRTMYDMAIGRRINQGEKIHQDLEEALPMEITLTWSSDESIS